MGNLERRKKCVFAAIKNKKVKNNVHDFIWFFSDDIPFFNVLDHILSHQNLDFYIFLFIIYTLLTPFTVIVKSKQDENCMPVICTWTLIHRLCTVKGDWTPLWVIQSWGSVYFCVQKLSFFCCTVQDLRILPNLFGTAWTYSTMLYQTQCRHWRISYR
jgi:hypothetical protein